MRIKTEIIFHAKEIEGKMDYTYAKRLEKFETGIFASLDEKKQQLISQGRKVYNLSIGTPDFKPPIHIIEVAKAAEELAEIAKLIGRM